MSKNHQTMKPSGVQRVERTMEFLIQAMQEWTDSLREHRLMMTGSEEPMTLRYLVMKFQEVLDEVKRIDARLDAMEKTTMLIDKRLNKAKEWAEKTVNPVISSLKKKGD